MSLSPLKILIVVTVALILLGPDKLPEVARQLGGAWRTLKGYQQKIEDDIRSVMPDLPATSEIARLARSPVNLLNSLADRAQLAEDSVEAEKNAREYDAMVAETQSVVDSPPEIIRHEPLPQFREPHATNDPSLN